MDSFRTEFPLKHVVRPQTHYGKHTIAGQDVFVATDNNTKGRYQHTNHDRAAVVSLEGASRESLAHAAHDGMEAAHEAVFNLCINICEHQSEKAQKADNFEKSLLRHYTHTHAYNIQNLPEAAVTNLNEAEESVKEALNQEWNGPGGSTGTVAVFDPEAFTIDLFSRGDSQAYVVLSDGQQHISVPISCAEHNPYQRNFLTNSLGIAEKPHSPLSYTFIGQQVNESPIVDPYHADLAMSAGSQPLQLEALITKAAEEYKLSTEHPIKAMLVLTTDGVDAARNIESYGDDALSLHEHQQTFTYSRIAERQLAGLVANSDEPAQNLLNKALEHSKDNCTAVVIPLEKGKGAPIAAMVADGFGKYGNRIAQEATKAFEKKILRVRMQQPGHTVSPSEPPTPDKGSQKPDITR